LMIATAYQSRDGRGVVNTAFGPRTHAQVVPAPFADGRTRTLLAH
jgi:hypothetical protein